MTLIVLLFISLLIFLKISVVVAVELCTKNLKLLLHYSHFRKDHFPKRVILTLIFCFDPDEDFSSP